MAGKANNLQNDSKLALVRPMKRISRIHGEETAVTIGAETFDLDEVSAYQIAGAMLRPEANSIAAKVAFAVAKERGAKSETAVYIIASETPGVVKIGIAGDPHRRLCGVQNGYWQPLRIAGLVWVYGSARKVEQSALGSAKRAGRRIKGEWVSYTPSEAALLIAEAIMTTNELAADSAMWIRNRSRLMDARCDLAAGDSLLPVEPVLQLKRVGWRYRSHAS